MIDHYGLLGVSRDATAAVVNAAYNGGLADLRAAMARGEAPDASRLDELRAAWKVLGDPAARAAYDATLDPPLPPLPPAAPRSTHRSPPPRALDFEFTGAGGEYFRIWIVNLALSIVTLGIYSAWAKVRREQYFHRNLRLDGTAFDYHGRPMAILKGRVIAFVLLMLVGVAEKQGSTVYGLTLLGLAPAVPWLVVRALRFRAHNTSYRGLRFGFDGGYRAAAIAFLGFGLLAMISFGLLFPLFLQRQKKLVLDHLRFGGTPFACGVGAGRFFRIFLAPIVGVVALIAVSAAIAAADVALSKVLVPSIVFFGLLAVVALTLPYIRVRTTNAVWNAVTLGEARFESTMTIRGYLGISVVNMLLLVVTLGLFWPWAQVRMARYRAKCMHFETTTSLDEFVAGEATRAPAVGDEAAEMFDFDIAL